MLLNHFSNLVDFFMVNPIIIDYICFRSIIFDFFLLLIFYWRFSLRFFMMKFWFNRSRHSSQNSLLIFFFCNCSFFSNLGFFRGGLYSLSFSFFFFFLSGRSLCNNFSFNILNKLLSSLLIDFILCFCVQRLFFFSFFKWLRRFCWSCLGISSCLLYFKPLFLLLFGLHLSFPIITIFFSLLLFQGKNISYLFFCLFYRCSKVSNFSGFFLNFFINFFNIFCLRFSFFDSFMEASSNSTSSFSIIRLFWNGSLCNFYFLFIRFSGKTFKYWFLNSYIFIWK